jgi:hypothetical protein
MKTILAILFSIVGATQMCAQNIKILSAAEQSWSGGQCCSHGINYEIRIESTDTVSLLKFDTVWIGNYPYTKGNLQNLSANYYKSNGKIYYSIVASQSWSGREENVIEKLEMKKIQTPPKYKGKGCIVASSVNSKHYLEVNAFQLLAPIPYP